MNISLEDIGKTKLSELHEIIQTLAKLKGINNESFFDFVNPDYEKLHDPFLFNDAEKAAQRIWKAIKNNEKIVIYADFDADGIPGSIVLKDFFDILGFKNYIVYIPHRNKEGYGLHKSAIEKFISESANLLITVDLGISAKDTVNFAQNNNIDVIVTDHHEAGTNTPDAFAILDPKNHNEKYPFKELCGAAVVFKLVQILIKYARNNNFIEIKNLKEGWEKWLLDLVAISTISDMVPLVDENRILTYWGLYVLRKTKRKGLRKFFKHFSVPLLLLDETDVAFTLSPKINTASRMSDPSIAYELISSSDDNKIEKQIIELERLNKLRQKELSKISKEAKKCLELRDIDNLKVVVVGDSTWSPAILGLVASKLADEYEKTVCVWGKDESGVYKGSCRSKNGINIAELFELKKDKFIEFGGHKGAGGFSVDFENIVELEKELNAAAHSLELSPDKNDIEISARTDSIDWNLYKELRLFAPFGIANEAPSFRFENIEIISKRVFGKHKEHIEFLFKSKNSNKILKAIAFFAKKDWFEINPNTIVGKLEKNYFMNKLELRIKVDNLF